MRRCRSEGLHSLYVLVAAGSTSNLSTFEQTEFETVRSNCKSCSPFDMSCQIKGIANLTNTSNIKEVLFGDSIKRCKLSCSVVCHRKRTTNVNAKILQLTFRKMCYRFKTASYHCPPQAMSLPWRIIQK